jgi:heme exporter protein D
VVARAADPAFLTVLTTLNNITTPTILLTLIILTTLISTTLLNKRNIT